MGSIRPGGKEGLLTIGYNWDGNCEIFPYSKIVLQTAHVVQMVGWSERHFVSQERHHCKVCNGIRDNKDSMSTHCFRSASLHQSTTLDRWQER